MKYPEELREKWNECMFDERDIIQRFLEKQYDIRYGRQRDTWHFEDEIEVVSSQGSLVKITDIMLDKDCFVKFHVKAFGHDYSWWECFNFAYGELSKVIEALPDADEIVKNRAVSDLNELAVKTNVRKLLEKNPYTHVVEAGSVFTQFVPRDVTFKELADKYGSNYITKLRDHVQVEYLRSTKEYNEVMFLLTKEPNRYKEASDSGVVTFAMSDIKFDVTSVGVDDSGHLVIFGGDINSNVCDNMALTEKDIKVEYLEVILKWLNETKWDDIMDTYNAHDKELVRKINAAWKSNKYHERFGTILLALLTRDKEEFENRFDCDVELTEEFAYTNANQIMEGVCDDQDLECILNFIRYEE